MPLLHIVVPEVLLVRVKPGICCMAAQDVPLHVIEVEWLPFPQL
jgi:hypothetical protein